MLVSLKFYILLITVSGALVQCMKVIFERANVTLCNEKYVTNLRVYVRRLNRKSPYYLNIIAITKHQWTNNITVDIVFYQFLHNEYRRSFVEMHHKFCDLINDEPYIGGMLKMGGVVCPMKAGLQNVMNMTAPTVNFPNVFPFEKGRVDIAASITATKEPVVTLYAEASFKQ